MGLGGGRRQIRWFRRKHSELYSGHVELEMSVLYDVDVFKVVGYTSLELERKI